MNATRILTIALGLQLALAVFVWWPSSPDAPRPLIALERDAIEELEVAARPAEGEPEEPVVLARAGEGWVIRSEDDFPALSAPVDELLDAVLGLRTDSTISTQKASHAALSIGDDSYARRLTVRGGGEVSSWLLASATSRSVYARAPDEDTVYTARGASEWSFRDQPASYRDASYVEADPASFEAVAVRNGQGAFRLENRDGAWTLADLAAGESADAAAIETFVSGVAKLRMTEPVGRGVLPEHGLSGDVRVDWTIAAADQSLAGGYEVGAEVDSEVFVKAVDHPFVVRVAASQVASLRDATRMSFLAASGAADGATGSEDSPE